MTDQKQDPNADASGNGGEQDKVTFTQQELDALFAERAKRASEGALSELFKSLGVSDAASLKTALDKVREADEAQKTELQKLLDKASKAEASVADLEAARKAEIEAFTRRILDTEIKIAASRDVKDKDGKITRQAFRAEAVDDVILLVDRKNITEKDGAYTGIEGALDALAKAKPWLLAEQATPEKPKGSPITKERIQQKPVEKEAKAPGKYSRL